MKNFKKLEKLLSDAQKELEELRQKPDSFLTHLTKNQCASTDLGEYEIRLMPNKLWQLIFISNNGAKITVYHKTQEKCIEAIEDLHFELCRPV